jgi:hypothetical protein
MPDEVAVLRAAGQEQAAQMLEAFRAGQASALPPATPETPAADTPAEPAVPSPTPEIPAAPLVPAPVAAAEAQRGPQPPAGKAPLQTVEAWEALPQEERLARMDEVDALLLEGK